MLLLLAVVMYAATFAYLTLRGVPRERILTIIRHGLAGGAILFVVCAVFNPALLGKAPDIFALCAMFNLVGTAATKAREEILGNITCAGVVLLNVAVNLAPPHGPLLLSLAAPAMALPIEYGPVRYAAALAILYLPSLLAMFLLWRGPPGNVYLRSILGAWVCWVGIAAVAGVATEVMAGFESRSALRWLASILGAVVALHLLMLAAAFALSVLHGSRSLANSLTVDGLGPWRALAMAAIFGTACLLLLTSPISAELKSNAIVAGGLAIAAGLAAVSRRKVPEAGTAVTEGGTPPEEPPLWGSTELAIVAVAIFFTVAWFAPRSYSGQAPKEWLLPLPAVEVDLPPWNEIEPKRSPTFTRLERDGVPYEVRVVHGVERIAVPLEHRGLLYKALDEPRLVREWNAHLREQRERYRR